MDTYAGGPSFDVILSQWKQRKLAQGPILERMRGVQAVYNGDVVIPIADMDRTEKVWLANLLQTGLDQTAQRIASTTPDVRYTSNTPGQKLADRKAKDRREANLGWWTQNKMGLKVRRRARWLIGYGTTPVMVRPNDKWQMPMWQIRNPLTTFPGPTLDPDDHTPPDCIFSYKRSLSWLRQYYPELTSVMRLDYNAKPDDPYDVVEYVDAECHVLGAVGAPRNQWEAADGKTDSIELLRLPNRAGICPVVCPGRITLDRIQGQFDGMVGVYQLQARLMALEVIAVERGIFPDTYLISRQNEIAAFIDGPFDGRTGKVNVVKGGDVKEVQTNPGFQTNPTIDRLERAQRLTAGIPTDLTGEAGTNVRTGRRSEVLLSAVLDFPIAEAQEILSESLCEENKRAIAIDKAYFDTTKSFYMNLNGAKGYGEYKPSALFDTDDHVVRYPTAGADANSLIVGLGQRMGTGEMSKQTARELDPMIENPERERDQITSEALEQALLAGIQQQASAGTLPPDDLAFVIQSVRLDKMELPEAIMAAQQRAQARQAAQVPPGAPAAQPGLSQPGMGAEAGTAAPAAGPPDLAALLQQLHGSTQTQVQ